MAIIVAWVVAVVVAGGSFAFVYRLMDERTRELKAIVAGQLTQIAKQTEYIELLLGEIRDLTSRLSFAEGTWNARVSEAKLAREIRNIKAPPPDGLDNEQHARKDEPAADWTADDE